mmetsp:Transcript_7608/g.18775  ORF Transcript_7608/g.18775 Transcript_7608/m.18775 type:complete len:226 (+) Transcript_7608:426-1103(+)|eukprot:CAMPEP_0113465182 /NCGR_PEP_ID=MMETSP0014_2-20120614/13602_1 /TAXON_ID=2857 /ORGANISM="Nitzschia sp." /LENGTH=225 /DNA_ID=CAMNT_0000357321 /DNA_START=414 /DNA_END=1091 /DNA_ORIENTATION=- /assembly_acc=CAM_ASM_000159
MSSSSNSNTNDGNYGGYGSSNSTIDAGAPLPDFSGAGGIKLTTVAPSLGIGSQGHQQPDYLEYDTEGGRGLVVTMFANAGLSYLVGITGGGLYGLQHGLKNTPSSKFRVQLNSVLNSTGRYGSKTGNTFGVVAVLYSLYEGLADQLDIDSYARLSSSSSSSLVDTMSFSPPVAACLTGVTYYGPSSGSIRVATLGGAIGASACLGTYALYSVVGKPYGSYGFLWF